MQSSSIIRIWGKRIVLTIALLVVCLGSAIALNRLGGFTRVEALLTVIVLGGGGVLVYRQSRISRQLKTQSSQFWDLAEFEKGISHQIQRSAIQADEIAKKNAALLDDYAMSVKEQLGTVRNRIKELEGSVAAVAASAKLTSSPAEDKNATKADAKQKPTKKTSPAKGAALEKDTRLTSALEKDTLRIHLQPIVELPSRNPTYFETSIHLKLETDENMDPAEFNELANASGIKPALDTKMLFSSVRMLRTLKSLNKTSGIFCQLSRASLTEAKSFKSILEFLEANQTLEKSLILEISQEDFDTLNRRELKRFDSIADLGYSLALDQVQKLDIPVESIAAYGFEFIKIPIGKILQAGLDEDQNGFHALPIAAALRENNVSVIASQVTQESEAISLIDMNMAYGQGSLFAPPRPVKKDLLGS